jgi:hypothetical protein
MSKWLNRSIITLCGVLLVGFLGCSAMQDAIIPCYINPEAVEYADEEPISFLPYTSLWDAERIALGMEHSHFLNQRNLVRLMEDDDTKHSFLSEQHASYMKSAREFRDIVFDPSGPVGAMIPLLLGGTFGALAIKRPGDKSKKQIEEEKKNGNSN